MKFVEGGVRGEEGEFAGRFGQHDLIRILDLITIEGDQQGTAQDPVGREDEAREFLPVTGCGGADEVCEGRPRSRFDLLRVGVGGDG